MTVLDALEGYRRWAPSYVGETAISQLEDDLVRQLTPPLTGRRLLDAGCGVGRRLRDADAAQAVGVDLSPEMLEQGGLAETDRIRLLVGDVRALPLPDAAFDVVWCRLVIGHLSDCRGVYGELARVTAPGGFVIVTDFHADAWTAGHRRSFRDAEGVYEVEHFVHSATDQIAAAGQAGLTLDTHLEAPIGLAVRSFYERAGRLPLYAEHEGLNVVLALAFRREG